MVAAKLNREQGCTEKPAGIDSRINADVRQLIAEFATDHALIRLRAASSAWKSSAQAAVAFLGIAAMGRSRPSEPRCAPIESVRSAENLQEV